MSDLLSGSRLATLAEQRRTDPDAYGVVQFADDLVAGPFDDLEDASPGSRDEQLRLHHETLLHRIGEILACDSGLP